MILSRSGIWEVRCGLGRWVENFENIKTLICKLSPTIRSTNIDFIGFTSVSFTLCNFVKVALTWRSIKVLS